MSIPYGQNPNPYRTKDYYDTSTRVHFEIPEPTPITQYERIVSVLREFPEVRNIRAIAEALNEELSK